MDIFAFYQEKLIPVIRDFAGDDFDVIKPALKFSVPPAKMHADYATNAAMLLAKPRRQSPASLAEQLVTRFAGLPELESVQAVGGYVNFVFSARVWREFLATLITDGAQFGAGTPQGKVLLEFISANPTGPLHIGHTRGAILGLALDKLLTKAGYDVTTEYYINDYGVQIRTLLDSLRWRYQQACGQKVEMPPGVYPGEYLIPVAQDFYQKYGDTLLTLTADEFFARCKDEAVAAMMEIIRADVRSLGLEYDSFVSETAIVESGAITRALQLLSEQTRTITDEDGKTQTVDVLYHGRLSAPVGRPANDLEAEESRHDDGEQTIFRSTLFGDDRDRVVARSDGSTTYFASDIAYHYDKIQRGYPTLINLFGADHGGYVKRLTGAVSALSDGKAHLEIQLMQLVALQKDGQPLRMSKRAGNFVLLSDVIEQVDVDELKLFILAKSADTPMTFDLSVLKQKSKDNPVYYIQYAATRTYSLQRKYAATFGREYQFAESDLAHLDLSNAEIRGLTLALARYPGVIQQAARHRAPYVLVTYLQELAGLFHTYWSTGAKFIDTDAPEATRGLLALVSALQIVIVDALECLGIRAREQM